MSVPIYKSIVIETDWNATYGRNRLSANCLRGKFPLTYHVKNNPIQLFIAAAIHCKKANIAYFVNNNRHCDVAFFLDFCHLRNRAMRNRCGHPTLLFRCRTTAFNSLLPQIEIRLLGSIKLMQKSTCRAVVFFRSRISRHLQINSLTRYRNRKKHESDQGSHEPPIFT